MIDHLAPVVSNGALIALVGLYFSLGFVTGKAVLDLLALLLIRAIDAMGGRG